METRRLQYLVELARLGSMRAVADTLRTTTSTVSQQIAALSKETGAALVEPQGRLVRLTPAGRRLVEHATVILAAVEAAQRDLAPGAEPSGTVRVAGFATALRAHVLPMVAELAGEHPLLHVLVREHEPAEALALLAADEIDLALTYEYNLAPAALDPALVSVPLWTASWGLGVPAAAAEELGTVDSVTSTELFALFRSADWIGNSRNTADETAIRTLASMAGFSARVTHRSDSLDLVEDMITAGLGVGLLPVGRPTVPGVRLLPLNGPEVLLRASAVTRRGRSDWPPLALLADLIRQRARLSWPAGVTPGGAGLTDR
ncbi:LysR family transcriptional regulator [Streptacidiphilus pinicola]|uniref:LysR family transcriptional regulator n=1 Tax=Streptacidiphilus pinicola TaxID=2219663 RepID=A0A2X0J964_9ACTN|nr:LysR family transcriptional regulator [Streptacidiphilus pinicola]RAG86836.1 LysR family transcriptional regulator [Streptacidiphilus pinicola]